MREMECERNVAREQLKALQGDEELGATVIQRIRKAGKPEKLCKQLLCLVITLLSRWMCVPVLGAMLSAYETCGALQDHMSVVENRRMIAMKSCKAVAEGASAAKLGDSWVNLGQTAVNHVEDMTESLDDIKQELSDLKLEMTLVIGSVGVPVPPLESLIQVFNADVHTAEVISPDMVGDTKAINQWLHGAHLMLKLSEMSRRPNAGNEGTSERSNSKS